MRTMGDERILGSQDFVESVLRQAHETYDQQTLAMAKGVDLDTLIGGVADHFQIEPQIIKSASKQRTISPDPGDCLLSGGGPIEAQRSRCGPQVKSDAIDRQ